MRAQLPDLDFEVRGLFWADLKQRIVDRYPIVSPRLASALDRIGIGAADEFRKSDAYQVMRETLLDVFAYSLLHDMRHMLQTDVLLRLMELTRGDGGESIIVAHSLGAALMVHVAALQRRVDGRVPHGGLVLLAPPLGIRSPVSAIPDPLAVTPDSARPTGLAGGLEQHLAHERLDWVEGRSYDDELSEDQRHAILEQVAQDWIAVGRRALHFCVNRNDMVCSDVRFELLDRRRDVVPIKQGFDADEVAILNAVANYHEFEFGAPKVDQVSENHDVLTYLEQPAVTGVLRALIEEGA